jgi:16S rRNA (guanine527-N7)-methyltransferase
VSYGPADLQRDLAVPRETCERLETHRRLLEIWSRRINLIGPNELADYWRRHALDCGQLVRHAPEARLWVDMGSGAGFPGLIVACLPLADARVTLVEANPKKVAFLREAIRETGAPAQVLEGDIDVLGPELPPQHVVTARAFAPLPRIAASAKPILDRGAIGLFPKGADFRAEIAAAADQGWVLTVEPLPSLSDPTGRILRIEGAKRAGTTDGSG